MPIDVGQVATQRRWGVGKRRKARLERSWVGVRARLFLQIVEQNLPVIGFAAQHEVDPGPGFAIFARRHLLKLIELLEPSQIGIEIPRPDLPEEFQMLRIDSVAARFDLEIWPTLRQAKEGQLSTAMQNGVCGAAWRRSMRIWSPQ